MTESQKAVAAAAWLNENQKRIRFYTDLNYDWVRVSPHIAGICDSHSLVTESELIAEAKRLGFVE